MAGLALAVVVAAAAVAPAAAQFDDGFVFLANNTLASAAGQPLVVQTAALDRAASVMYLATGFGHFFRLDVAAFEQWRWMDSTDLDGIFGSIVYDGSWYVLNTDRRLARYTDGRRDGVFTLNVGDSNTEMRGIYHREGEDVFYAWTGGSTVFEFAFTDPETPVRFFDRATLDASVDATPGFSLGLGGFSGLRVVTGSDSVAYLYIVTRSGQVAKLRRDDFSVVGGAILVLCESFTINAEAWVADTINHRAYFACSPGVGDPGAAVTVHTVDIEATNLAAVPDATLELPLVPGVPEPSSAIPPLAVCQSAYIDLPDGTAYFAVSPQEATETDELIEYKGQFYAVNLRTLTVDAIKTFQYDNKMYREVEFDEASRVLYTVQTPPSNTPLVRISTMHKREVGEPCAGCVNGVCTFGLCECTEPWKGPRCDAQCPANCEEDGRGTCSPDGICVCLEGVWTGPDCTRAICPNDCSGNGVCDLDATACVCNDGYSGVACDQAACRVFTSCDSCLSSRCGWCDATSTCSEGDRLGPFDSFCPDWFNDACPSTLVASQVGVVIVSMVAFALLLANMVATLRDDRIHSPDRLQMRESVWKAQRSFKSWYFFEQLQFLSVVGALGFVYTTRLLSFSAGFAWTNLWIEMPFHEEPKSVSSSRSAGGDGGDDGSGSSGGRGLLSVYQYTYSLGFREDGIFTSAVLVFVLLVLVAYAFMTVLGLFRDQRLKGGKGDIWKFVHERRMYVVYRIALMAYTGVMAASAYRLYNLPEGAGWALWVLALLVFCGYGFGFPYYIWWLLKGTDAKVMIAGSFKKEYGCLYEHVYYKRIWFALVPIVLKFVMAVAVGFFQDSPEFGAALIIVAKLVYMVLLLALKPRPYTDNTAVLLDVARQVLDIATLGLAITFRDSPFSVSLLIADGIIIVLQIVCLALCVFAFFNDWLYMADVRSVVELFKKLNKKKGKAATEEEMQAATAAEPSG